MGVGVLNNLKSDTCHLGFGN